MLEYRLPDLDLEQIARSGQCFCWRALEWGGYGVTAAGRYLEVKQQGDLFCFTCAEEEFYAFWRGYFDLDADYGAVKRAIDPEDALLTRAAAFGGGIRLLRQDLWEVMVCFLLSQNNNITRITRSVRLLCRRWGEHRSAPGTRAGSYFTFPGPDDLAGAAQEDFAAIGFGYRAKYMAALCAQMRDGGLARLEAELRPADGAQAERRLMELYGVGKKVADCICLFGLHKRDFFPVDTHIRHVLEARYPLGFPFERYQGSLGILQQYLFYYDLYHG